MNFRHFFVPKPVIRGQNRLTNRMENIIVNPYVFAVQTSVEHKTIKQKESDEFG